MTSVKCKHKTWASCDNITVFFIRIFRDSKLLLIRVKEAKWRSNKSIFFLGGWHIVIWRAKRSLCWKGEELLCSWSQRVIPTLQVITLLKDEKSCTTNTSSITSTMVRNGQRSYSSIILFNGDGLFIFNMVVKGAIWLTLNRSILLGTSPGALAND